MKKTGIGIVSIAPPNMVESNYVHKPLRVDNKIKLEIRENSERTAFGISPLDDYTMSGLSENNVRNRDTLKKPYQQGQFLSRPLQNPISAIGALFLQFHGTTELPVSFPAAH